MKQLDLLKQSNGESVIPEEIRTVSFHKADWSHTNEHANGCVKETNDYELELTSTEVKIRDKKPMEGNKNAQPIVGLFQLFRYADKLDVICLIFGTIFTFGTGIAFPVNLIVYGDVATGYVFNDIYKSRFANNSTNASSIAEFPYGDKYKDIFDFVLNYNYTLYFCLIGVGSLVCAYLEFVFWNISAERQVNRIRKLFYQSVMRQEIGWFDTNKAGDLGNLFTQERFIFGMTSTQFGDMDGRFTSRAISVPVPLTPYIEVMVGLLVRIDMQNLASGLGDKTALCFQWIVTWFSCYIIAIIKGWNLALATMLVVPLLAIFGALSTRWMKNMSLEELKAYSSAGAVAEEVFSAIRTVTAFNGQEKESQKFDDRLSNAHSLATRKGLILGLCTGAVWFFSFTAMAIAFWYGTELVINKELGLEPGNIITIFLSVILGTSFLAQAFPAIETISAARAAATRVFEIIERDSDIDVTAEKGYIPETVSGNIELKDIHFHYPSRRDVQVLKGLSLRVDVGKTVAIVGSSGSGKSTVVQLIQRFYNPQQGQVLLDGRGIKDLNLKWLREQIGVVSQEPVLFATTIRENIRYGRMDVTDDEIEDAAKKANAHQFISMFPKGYDTLVGDRGDQMSGGQKQRIAIARALVRNPKILLLDEATSALDNESEAIVQKAIEKAQIGRTTIIIAHRLSTIRNADTIHVLVNGQVVEQGTHSDLMQKDGAYHGLVKHQEVQVVSEEKRVLDESVHDIANFPARKVDVSNAVKEQPLSQESHKTASDASNVTENLPEFSIKKIVRLSAPEWYLLVVGCIAAVIVGVVPPSYSFLVSEFLGVLSGESDQQMRHSTKILVAITMGIAAVNSVVRALLLMCFTNAGANLTRRLRTMTFRAILRQDIAFFDDPNNSVGHLTTRLSNDCTMVQGATGFKFSTLLESISTIIASVVIAFFYSWKLTLVTLSFMPIMIAVGTIQGRLITRFSKSDKRSVEEVGQIFFQSINNMRTVVSLTLEETFLLKYSKINDFMQREGIKRAFAAGLFFAMSNGIVFFSYATALTYGAYLIQNENLAFKFAVRVFSLIIFGGWSIGKNSSNSQDFNKAKLATSRLFAIMERVSPIDAATNDDKTCESLSGAIEFQNVTFHYQSRPDVNVLNDISFVVQPGETLALAGTSGCGKSTTVSLIERFYDPLYGKVLADGHDLKSLNLNWLRSQISVVSQEPTLFNASIRENIAYGYNNRVVTMEEIIQAAKSANIHNFIYSLPMGYETNVGARGTQLSGGQKQRIAIARALIRNPKILLLDEATSALDSESEKTVQEALNKAREGRTCIVIAHRLSTIQNADKIAIIHKGGVVELGNHAELMAKRGAYYRLQNAQQRR